MKTRKFVILFILVTVLATIVISCQVRIRETETYLKSRDGATKDLPVIGSKTKSGGMSKIKIVPTALPGVVTLSIPNALPSSTQSIEETFTDTDDPITLKQIRWTLEPAFPNLKFENLTNLIQIDDAILRLREKIVYENLLPVLKLHDMVTDATVNIRLATTIMISFLCS